MYINCHSYHSLRYGTLSVDDLVSQAQTCNVKVLALTDINTVTGIYDFAKACKDADIKPVVGMEFRSHNRLLYIGLAKNRAGIGEMCRLLTAHNCDGAELPLEAPEFEIVVETVTVFEFEGLIDVHNRLFILLNKLVTDWTIPTLG
jgi:DNA polymerase III alpha subunit